jgi:hypothetical protein
MIGYKIIEITDGKPFFMFCGFHGSRKLEVDTWLEAEKKMVKDGTSKTDYLSGFHVIAKDIEQMRKYATRFKNKVGKYVVEVEYHTFDKKPTKGSLALLADFMMVPKKSLETAIPLEEL